MCWKSSALTKQNRALLEGELLAVVRPNGGGWATRYVHHDMLDSVRALTDEAAVVVESRAYEAFGARVTGGADPLAYGFAGEPSEGESGLAYHRARWMDARAGRFLGEDPLMPGRRGVHGYVYASNSPVVRVDPSGEVDVAQMALVGALVGVLASQAGCHSTLVRGAISPSENGGLLDGAGNPYLLSEWVLGRWYSVFNEMAPWLNLREIVFEFHETLPTWGGGWTESDHKVLLDRSKWRMLNPSERKRLLGHETTHAAQYSETKHRTDVSESVMSREARECPADGPWCYLANSSLGGVDLYDLDVLGKGPKDNQWTLEQIAVHAEPLLKNLLDGSSQ